MKDTTDNTNWTKIYTILAGAMKLGRFASDAGAPILPKEWAELTA